MEHGIRFSGLVVFFLLSPVLHVAHLECTKSSVYNTEMNTETPPHRHHRNLYRLPEKFSCVRMRTPKNDIHHDKYYCTILFSFIHCSTILHYHYNIIDVGNLSIVILISCLHIPIHHNRNNTMYIIWLLICRYFGHCDQSIEVALLLSVSVSLADAAGCYFLDLFGALRFIFSSFCVGVCQSPLPRQRQRHR